MFFINSILKPTYNLLSPAFQKRGMWMVALMTFQALLDFINISAFIPLIGLIAKPDFISSLAWLPFDLGKREPSQLILFLASAILTFLLIKQVIVWYVTKAKAQYAYRIAHHISMQLLNDRLFLDYKKFTQLDYSEEVNRITQLPLVFANNIVIALTTLLAEGLVALFIFLGVLLLNVKLMISLLFILIPAGVVYFFNRKKIKFINDELDSHFPKLVKHTLQILEGWPEIRTNQREKNFQNRFKKTHADLMQVIMAEHHMQVFTVRTIEFFAGLIICFIIIWSLFFKENYQTIIFSLIIYVGASFRLLPSIARIMSSFIQISSHEYLFKELKSENLNSGLQNSQTQKISFDETIQLKQVSFSHDQRTTLFENLNLEIKKGEKIVICGKSGSGKSSLLLLLLGVLRPANGSIYFDGTEITDLNLLSYQSMFSYVSQNPYVLEGTIQENIAFGIAQDEVNKLKIWEALQQVDLADFVRQLPEKEETKIHEKGIVLSGGQKQRIALARALYANREILILDEVTNQLDPETESKIAETLQKLTTWSGTILMVSHHQQLLPLFDRVLKLKNGRLEAFNFNSEIGQ